jgi:hypothetical protein
MDAGFDVSAALESVIHLLAFLGALACAFAYVIDIFLLIFDAE